MTIIYSTGLSLCSWYIGKVKGKCVCVCRIEGASLTGLTTLVVVKLVDRCSVYEVAILLCGVVICIPSALVAATRIAGNRQVGPDNVRRTRPPRRWGRCQSWAHNKQDQRGKGIPQIAVWCRSSAKSGPSEICRSIGEHWNLISGERPILIPCVDYLFVC